MTEPHWLGCARVAVATVVVCLGCGVAGADDLGAVRLFDQDYILQRFDYNAQVQFPDLKTPGYTCRLWGVSGATYDSARGRLILSNNTQQNQFPWSYKNYVVEVEVLENSSGHVSGLRHTRTLIGGDATTMPYDLDPRGLTINTSPSGLGSGGNLVVACGNNWLRGFDINTGQPVVWPPSLENGFTLAQPNTTTEDATFVASANSFFTLWRSPMSACTIFNRHGRTGPAFLVGRGRVSQNRGLPSAISSFEPWPDFPRSFGLQPVIMVGTDDAGPALEAYDTSSRLLAREALSSRLAPGVKVFPLHASNAELWISAIANDHETGRIFVFNRGAVTGTTDVFVLDPVPTPCPADFNLDGFLDFFDYDEYNAAFEIGDPRSDFNADGFLDFFDYDDFRMAFEVGC